jgi:regulator of replication initiation timing
MVLDREREGVKSLEASMRIAERDHEAELKAVTESLGALRQEVRVAKEHAAAQEEQILHALEEVKTRKEQFLNELSKNEDLTLENRRLEGALAAAATAMDDADGKLIVAVTLNDEVKAELNLARIRERKLILENEDLANRIKVALAVSQEHSHARAMADRDVAAYKSRLENFIDASSLALIRPLSTMIEGLPHELSTPAAKRFHELRSTEFAKLQPFLTPTISPLERTTSSSEKFLSSVSSPTSLPTKCPQASTTSPSKNSDADSKRVQSVSVAWSIGVGSVVVVANR